MTTFLYSNSCFLMGRKSLVIPQLLTSDLYYVCTSYIHSTYVGRSYLMTVSFNLFLTVNVDSCVCFLISYSEGRTTLNFVY